MLTNIGLWIIIVAAVVFVPLGCIMTRPSNKDRLPPLH
jgi:hypothetical protein